MFGSKRTTVINTTTVDNNIYLENDISNQVDVTAEFNPTFANAVTVDTAPIAAAVANAVAPIERMGQAITQAMDANLAAGVEASKTQAGALAALGVGLASVGGGLGSLGDGLRAMGDGDAKQSEGLAGLADQVQSAGKIAAAILTVAALWFLFKDGRLPDIEVSA